MPLWNAERLSSLDFALLELQDDTQWLLAIRFILQQPSDMNLQDITQNLQKWFQQDRQWMNALDKAELWHAACSSESIPKLIEGLAERAKPENARFYQPVIEEKIKLLFMTEEPQTLVRKLLESDLLVLARLAHEPKLIDQLQAKIPPLTENSTWEQAAAFSLLGDLKLKNAFARLSQISLPEFDAKEQAGRVNLLRLIAIRYALQQPADTQSALITSSLKDLFEADPYWTKLPESLLIQAASTSQSVVNLVDDLALQTKAEQTITDDNSTQQDVWVEIDNLLVRTEPEELPSAVYYAPRKVLAQLNNAQIQLLLNKINDPLQAPPPNKLEAQLLLGDLLQIPLNQRKELSLVEFPDGIQTPSSFGRLNITESLRTLIVRRTALQLLSKGISPHEVNSLLTSLVLPGIQSKDLDELSWLARCSDISGALGNPGGGTMPGTRSPSELETDRVRFNALTRKAPKTAYAMFMRMNNAMQRDIWLGLNDLSKTTLWLIAHNNLGSNEVDVPGVRILQDLLSDTSKPPILFNPYEILSGLDPAAADQILSLTAGQSERIFPPQPTSVLGTNTNEDVPSFEVIAARNITPEGGRSYTVTFIEKHENSGKFVLEINFLDNNGKLDLVGIRMPRDRTEPESSNTAPPP